MWHIKLFILFALALPAVVLADNVKENKTDCINDNANVMKAFRPVGLCFSQVIHEQIGNNTSAEGCHTVEDFNKTFEDFRFRVIESCISEKDRQRFISRKKYLYELMTFSLNNNTFRDFYRNNGTEFLKLIQDDLATCVTSNGFNLTKSDKLNPRYWLRLNRPIYNFTSCDKTKYIKMCTEDQLVKHNCTESNAKYIIGLFDHLLEKCETDATTPSTTEETKHNWAPQLATVPPTIMGAMLMLFFF